MPEAIKDYKELNKSIAHEEGEHSPTDNKRKEAQFSTGHS
jgi:hypothetical protein